MSLYCDACCQGPSGKQPLAEGGCPVEITVNNIAGMPISRISVSG